jgi:hypothetical protein
MNSKTRKARRLVAVAISVAAHAGVITVLLLARLGERPVQPSPLIFAELIARAPEVPAPSGNAANEAVIPITPPEPIASAPEPRSNRAPSPTVTLEPPVGPG